MSTIAMNILNMLAQTTPSGVAPSGAAPAPDFFHSFMFPMMAVMAIFVFFSFNSKRKQDKQRQSLLGGMKRGDRIQTIGGVLGTIVEVRDTEIVVKVDESNNTKIKFVRSAISRVVTEEDKAEAK